MVRYFRRILKIRAIDSPNVRRAFMEMKLGREPSFENEFPGVLSYKEYVQRDATWDEPRKCVGLLAEFYAGPDVLLFPPHWLDMSHKLAISLAKSRKPRRARAMGVDPAEGGDYTSFAIVDEWGLIALHSERTPNTNEVFKLCQAYIKQYRVPPENVLFDRGGGGKQHADRLIEKGIPVRTIGFGEAVSPVIQNGIKSIRKKVDEQAERYVYRNRRAEMYWNLSMRMDPAGEARGYAIPDNGPQYEELRRQLAPFPKKYDDEGRIYLPPKTRKPGSQSKTPTLTEIIGRSPDDADAFALGVYAMTHKSPTMQRKVGLVSA